MTAEADIDEQAPKKGSKLPLILGVVLALAGGGGGFFVVSSGLIGGSEAPKESESAKETADVKELPKVAFVPIDPMLISLPRGGAQSVLRFSAQLEVPPEYQEEVASLIPRIVDVLNGYLRAVTVEELSEPSILGKLRAQMLRRIQIVTGEGRVRDLLIMEFVLN